MRNHKNDFYNYFFFAELNGSLAKLLHCASNALYLQVKFVLLNSYSQEEDKIGVLYCLVQLLHGASSVLYLGEVRVVCLIHL